MAEYVDTISRQAAIDALCSVCGVDCDKNEFVYGGKQEDQVILCPEHYALTQLPSAQPELAIKDCRNCKHGNYNDHWDTYFCYHSGDCNDWDKWEPSAQPEGWMERNKDRILQAGKEGREVEFRIGGRLFAIREKAQ